VAKAPYHSTVAKAPYHSTVAKAPYHSTVAKAPYHSTVAKAPYHSTVAKAPYHSTVAKAPYHSTVAKAPYHSTASTPYRHCKDLQRSYQAKMPLKNTQAAAAAKMPQLATKTPLLLHQTTRHTTASVPSKIGPSHVHLLCSCV